MTLGLSPPRAWAKPTVATSHATPTPQHDRSSSFVSFVTFCSNPPYSSADIRLETPPTGPVLINAEGEPEGTMSFPCLSISPPLSTTQRLFARGKISLEMR